MLLQLVQCSSPARLGEIRPPARPEPCTETGRTPAGAGVLVMLGRNSRTSNGLALNLGHHRGLGPLRVEAFDRRLDDATYKVLVGQSH